MNQYYIVHVLFDGSEGTTHLGGVAFHTTGGMTRDEIVEKFASRLALQVEHITMSRYCEIVIAEDDRQNGEAGCTGYGEHDAA